MKPLVVSLPNGTTRTLTIQQEPQKRYWFAMCPVSCKVQLHTKYFSKCFFCKAINFVW